MSVIPISEQSRLGPKPCASSEVLTVCRSVTSADRSSGRRLGLVYLYKQGTFYPFAPQEGQRRDNLLEIQVRDLLGNDLPLEPQLSRWMPVWGAPGL